MHLFDNGSIFQEVARKVEDEETDENDRPLDEVTITQCEAEKIDGFSLPEEADDRSVDDEEKTEEEAEERPVDQEEDRQMQEEEEQEQEEDPKQEETEERNQEEEQD